MGLEQRVPQAHPLREIGRITDRVLVSLNEEFDSLYSASGRPSIAPEYVLRALLLQAFHSVRSERQLIEQLEYNLLPLVRRSGQGRCGVEPRGVLEQPRAFAGFGRGATALRRCDRAGQAFPYANPAACALLMIASAQDGLLGSHFSAYFCQPLGSSEAP